MQLKVKQFENINKILKCTTLVLTFIIIIISIINLYNIQSLVNFKQRVENSLARNNNKNPVGKPLHNVAQDNISSVQSQSAYYKPLNRNGEDTKRNSTETLLYRKRRYLQFPEGSSLQLVFNILLPIIDYTNYAILGITCALAYELPSKPLSELQDELIKQLQNGESQELLSNNDSPDLNRHIDEHHYQKHIKDKFSDIMYLHPSEYSDKNSYSSPEWKKDLHKNYIAGPYNPSYIQRRPIYEYYSKNPHATFENTKNAKFDSGNHFESIWNPIYNKSPYIRRQDANPKHHQHAVYHIMGKRGIQENKPSTVEEGNSWLNKLDQIHLRYHRSSRHALYSKLEAMFDKQGKNGTECVLRALCETGLRRHETEPGDVLTEVFRAVFTLPEDTDLNYKDYHPMHKARDDAHWNQKNCSQVYPLCENFIWDGNFRI